MKSSIFSRFKILILLSIVVANLVTPIFAEDKLINPIPIQKVYPDSAYYPFKRLWEKISSRILFLEDSQINNDKKLLNTRFSELYYTVDKNLLDEIQKSSERFSYQAGVYADKVKKQNNSEIKKSTIEEFKKYASDSAVIRNKLPSDTSFTRLLQYDIDTLNLLSDQLK